MRFNSLPPALSCLALILLTSTAPTSATPYPKDYLDERDATSLQNSTIAKRCDNPCGWSGQLCCDAGQTCYTDSSNQAQCGDGSASGATVTQAATSAAGDSGYWQYYTSTWVDTALITTTAVYSSFVSQASATAEATGSSQSPSCDYAANESPCGSICCASGQYCFTSGQCEDAGNGGYTTTAVVAGTTASPPTRPTTISNSLTTETISPTTTVPFQTPVATGANVTVTGAQASSGGGGLSGGAIAGIVIGVIVGLILLALLCFCCIAKGLWDLFTGIIFGRRREQRRRTEEVFVEEHYHHGSASGGGGRVWYGDRPSRPSRANSPKRGGWGGWGTVAAGLGALGVGLAGKRALDKRKVRREEKSDISSSYYSYDYTSESSPSSVTQDRRTRRSSRR
ncbi:hypothetical protein NA57DRAFT_52709 [Rhizodiscina lignyota]|uniref:Uncharacterized protein n=1 Tax=Rhizodiscina lignyota TaxID=1504668 RepID=A0A9P4MF29_9PEZI|nr:hypothetical protein NA57DRAFT_52709 [Rhizodiscina lignyota]